jgi:hypothetical protein
MAGSGDGTVELLARLSPRAHLVVRGKDVREHELADLRLACVLSRLARREMELGQLVGVLVGGLGQEDVHPLR